MARQQLEDTHDSLNAGRKYAKANDVEYGFLPLSYIATLFVKNARESQPTSIWACPYCGHVFFIIMALGFLMITRVKAEDDTAQLKDKRIYPASLLTGPTTEFGRTLSLFSASLASAVTRRRYKLT
jgi:hypothetical protein